MLLTNISLSAIPHTQIQPWILHDKLIKDVCYFS